MTTKKQFEKAFTDFLDSVYDQAVGRDTNRLHTVDSYLKARRDNIGAYAAYMPAILGIEIPDEAFYHPMIVNLADLVGDLLSLDNVSKSRFHRADRGGSRFSPQLGQDLASYNKEQAAGDDQYNILTIVMHQYSYTLDEALKWTADYHDEVKTRFLDGIERLPSFGPEVDPQLQQFIQAIAIWPRANDCWNFESGRYFGSKGPEIQKTRVVPIMPKIADIHCTLRGDSVVVAPVEL